MSDDAPLEYPQSDTEYYPEHVANSAKTRKTWQPELLQIMKKIGCSPEFDVSSDEESRSELKDSDEEEEFEQTNQPVQAQPTGNFKIKLPALKPPSKAGIATGATPSKALADKKTLSAPMAGASVTSKKRQISLEDSNNSNTDEDAKRTKKGSSKKKARLTEAKPDATDDQLHTRRRRGRPRKLVEKKAPEPISVPMFNASVFVSIENPPKVVRGKTYKTDKHVTQEPRVEGPFTLIRSMQWADFLNEVAGWVGVDKENLRINGLSWGFQKQKAHLPLTSEQAFKTMREQVKAKNGSATVIFIYHPICKRPENREQQDTGDSVDVNDVEDETRWGKKLSLDDKLAPIILQLETLYAVGQCSEHPDIHCFYTSVRPNESWHFELNKARFAVWANAINRKEVDYQRAPIGRTFFSAKDRIQTKKLNTILQAVPQTPPPYPGGSAFASPALHTYAWSPFYPGAQQGALNPMSGNPLDTLNSYQPPSPYYPFPSPFGHGSPMPWGYPAASPQTPGPKAILPTATLTAPPPPRISADPTVTVPTSFPDLKAWCQEHMLGEPEYEGLLKLGFRVGDGDELANLERAMWEWAGIAPLTQMRILAACRATIPSGSN